MINLEPNELYGLRNEKELHEAIQTLQEMGMTDKQINKILEDSKEDKRRYDNENSRPSYW